jgi:hypothetical protein
MRVVLILAGLTVFAVTATAEEPRQGSGRYAVLPSPDGFIRLDTSNGSVSHCGKRDAVWFCDTLIEDRTALEKRVAALTAEIAALTTRINALAARLDQAPPPVAAIVPPPTTKAPADAMSFPEKAMHRLFTLVRALKGGAPVAET